MRYAITYVSTASQKLSPTEIDELLAISKEKNNQKAITGILLYQDGNFLQVIEGEKKEILALFEVINKDRRHTNIIKIFGKDIHGRAFDEYHTDFITVEKNKYITTLEDYLLPLKMLDEKSKNVVMSILRVFLSA